jgi:hypothetical protein
MMLFKTVNNYGDNLVLTKEEIIKIILDKTNSNEQQKPINKDLILRENWHYNELLTNLLF